MPIIPPRRPAVGRLEVRHTTVSDPAAEPLRSGLLDEYVSRYGEGAVVEMNRFPDALFTPEKGGAFLLLVEDDVVVAGGAYKRLDAETAEFKRIWTHADHRRRGLARRVLAELERTAQSRGYRRIFLTTGPRQPEATGLYAADGYRQEYGPDNAPGDFPHYAFTKELSVVSPSVA